MAEFEPAFKYMIFNEAGGSRNGGYTNDADDPGGETKWGICKRDHPDVDIAHLTIDQAEAIYKEQYWDYDAINDQRVASKLFDTAVNLEGNGKCGKAVEIVQSACNRQLHNALAVPIATDGLFGPATVAAINRCNPLQLLKDMGTLQVKHYQDLVRSNNKLSKFLIGWCNRAIKQPQEVANAANA